MPIPPILDVFVVWHPDDTSGAERFRELQEHFHSPAFSGLVGGAVEVYARSAAWTEDGAPRPLGIETALADGLPAAQFNAIVPIYSLPLARAAADGGWARYLSEIADLANSPRVGVFAVPAKGVDLRSGALSTKVARFQTLPAGTESDASTLGRELGQAITQHIRGAEGDAARLTVFISHAKHLSLAEEGDATPIYELVRQRIASTHLADFFDARDIQSGSDWANELESNAASHALLIVRTDRYAEREWTQREVKAAKQSGVPVVSMYALRAGEQRGSFLMDHVPTVVCAPEDRIAGIDAALSALVSEALKATLWDAQTSYMEEDGFDWLPARSPEPTTLAPWLTGYKKSNPDDGHLWVMHPDPPLGKAEREILIEMCAVAGYTTDVNIYTPRTFASRGGAVHE